ncbi:MAG: ribosome small subunit-dependent GTPase A [Acidimicrobiales bacterium]
MTTQPDPPGLESYGWDDEWAQTYAAALAAMAGTEIDSPRPGRVIRHDGAGLIVATTDGPVRAMFGPAVTPPPVVGDWVVLDHAPNPRATLPRRSLLRRRAAGSEREQPMAANVDLVLIVCGLDRPVRVGRIQRTMTIANDALARSLVVLTKADTADSESLDRARAAVLEADPNLDVVALSARGGWGVEDLLAHIATRTVALLGESGAGKSTLVNALVNAEVAATGGVRLGDAKGRHTTTSRQLHLLATGGVLVDTPGIREVGIFADAEAVAETFPDIEELATQCRFNDCAHHREPSCAIREALDSGGLDPDRVERWRALEAEAHAAAIRADPVASRRQDRQTGRLYRDILKDKRR